MTIRVFAPIALLGVLVAVVAMWRTAAPVAGVERLQSVSSVSPVVDASPRIPTSPAAPFAASAAPVGRPAVTALPLQQAFESATDLFAFRQRLRPMAESGDAEARWMLSRVDEYCASFARDPAGFGRDSALIDGLQLDSARALGAARDRIGVRCGRFAPADAPTFVQLVERRREAAQSGSLAAEAALLAMGVPLTDDVDYRRNLVERVQASRDPEAFVALSPAMGVAASGDVALEQSIAGTQASELAWQLAACDLGLDCSPGGTLMTEYCSNGGICARDARQDFPTFVREAAVPRQGAEEIDRMKKALVEDAPESRHLLGMVTR